MTPNIISKITESVIDWNYLPRPSNKDNSDVPLSVLAGEAIQYPVGFPEALPEALIQAAETDNMIVFVGTKGEENELSYRSLLNKSLGVLGELQNRGSAAGQFVILQLDELDEFLITFWACVLGGMIPVPVLPFRNASSDDSSFKKLQKIASQLGEPIILMSARNADAVRDSTAPDNAANLLSGCRIFVYSEIGNSTCEGIIHQVQPDDLAFLQFTSGSTSFPKGVQITHANVLATIYGMMTTLGVSESSKMLNWMPYYHDMGLIAGHLMAVVGKCKTVAMKPFTFVRRPLLWLDKISQHRVSITFSPNFGLKRILEKATPEKLEHLDLSCLEIILNGAEPISVKTSVRFLELLNENCGLRMESLTPGYGMAEAGLAVSIIPREEVFRRHVLNRDSIGCGDPVQHVDPGNIKASWFADEGPLVSGMHLRIVDDADDVLPVGSVGHVQIRGPSVTRGYFSNEGANSKAFIGEWFRTGDLGFIYEERFTITGRVKDVVFVNGQNYYSHDFEHACDDVKGLEGLVVIGHYDEGKSEQEILAFVACSKESSGAREKTEIIRNVQKRINRCFDVTPTIFVLLKSSGEIPKTTSGKVMRHKLLENYMEGQFTNQCMRLTELLDIAPDLSSNPDSGKYATIAELKILIRHWWSEVLGISTKAIDDHDPFFSLGGTSIKAIEVLALAEETVDCIITHDMFKEHDTIHRLANYIAHENISIKCKLNDIVKLMPHRQESDLNEHSAWADDCHKYAMPIEVNVRDEDIAIIGMGCIFPQAQNVTQFWDVLIEGRDCVTVVPNDRYNINRYFGEVCSEINQSVSKWGSFIDSHCFDPKFFSLTESEAINMDPHQRAFLGAAWQAIQDSGLVNFKGSRMGVFLGASGTGFYHPREEAKMAPTTLTGTLVNLAAARVSNAFNLQGPSLTVDTACSSSLVSVDLACKSILLCESDTAIAGGVQIIESIGVYLMFSRAGILSPDGKCYTFSDKANGFVPGEGAGAVVLKRYRQAIEDGDRVYAVIKASATNNDGSSLGIMSPNPEGQENVIKTALGKAGIDPADIGYVEAHGTGTHIGDLIEMRSLSLAFNSQKSIKKQSCAIGSVKTNMGHQLAAAGIAGLIKAALCVHHKQIPPTLNCESERKDLKMAESPFFVCRNVTPWPKNGPRRYAAVNSFGFGGTNAHVILSDTYHEHNISSPAPVRSDEPFVVCLSAISEYSLETARSEFIEFANSNSVGTSLRDVAYTYNARRPHYRQNRIVIMARNLADAALVAKGANVEGGACIESKGMSRTRRRVAWLFSGQGSQHPAMGHMLFTNEPAFRNVVNVCDEIAKPLLGSSLRDLLTASTSHEQIDQTNITQPLVFVMDYALASLWKSWGIQPDFMLGHSVGEYAAACWAGVFSLEDALKIVIKRGNLMGSLPAGGGMTAVLLPPDELVNNIDSLSLPLDIAAYNSPMSTVVSGELAALEELHKKLDKQAVAFSSLKVSHAFHSRHTTPILAEFKNYMSGMVMHEPTIPIVSNVSGSFYQAGRESTPDYWVEHICNPVQFHKGIQCLDAEGASIFLEVGAQMHLSGFVKRIVSKDAVVAASLPKADTGITPKQQILLAQAILYAHGADIDWPRYFAAQVGCRSGGRMISVPTYPLERRSMFRVVGSQTYPFRHMFRSSGRDQYEYVPDPDSILFQDHVIMRTPILSGAGQCDLICHLHALSFGHAPKSLRKLSFHQPWLGKSTLKVAFTGDSEKEFSVTDERGRTVFKGYTETNTRHEVPLSISLEQIEQRLPLSYTHEMLYGLFIKCGIEYGPFHSRILSLRASDKEVLARLRPVSDDSAQWSSGYYLHPGMLDSAFQATAGILMATLQEDRGNDDFPAVMTIGIESIHIFKFLQDGEYYSHVTFDDDNDGDVEGDIINCNISIYEADGSPCVHIKKLQLKRIPAIKRHTKRTIPEVISKPGQCERPADYFHLAWKERLAPISMARIVPQRWLVFGSNSEIEHQLASGLANYGVDTLLVPYMHYRDADQAAIQTILENAGSVAGLLFLGDYDELPADDAADIVNLRSIFNIFKAIGAHSRKNKNYQKIPIVRATHHAYRPVESDAVDIRKSLITGFLRTARVEFPLMDVRQIDFGNTVVSELAARLVTEIASIQNTDYDGPETLYNNGKRYTLMVEPLTIEQKYERHKVFNHNKLFWIIGGTSGIGQVLARHLATKYQAGLVLSGSRRLPEPAQYDQYLAEHNDAIASTIKFIREIEGLGSEVRYVTIDVRRPESIHQSLGIIRSNYGKLDGIYFGALQLDDRMIVLKDWASYSNMLDMRVNGLNELIRQTAQDDIDFIVLFSSLAGITGNLGQSDYSASNVFMDNLPYIQPPNNNCRIISVQWGPWSLGQQVSDLVLDSMRRNGFLHISAQQGMEALEDIVLGNRRNVAFVPGSKNASDIASSINTLRNGLAAKPKRSKMVKTVNIEDSAMASTANELLTITATGQFQLLVDEFSKQRGLLMQLFENQNALLSTLMRGASADTLQEREEIQSHSVWPVPQTTTELFEVAKTPFGHTDQSRVDKLKTASPTSISNPSSQMDPASSPPEASSPATEVGAVVSLFDFVRSLMAKAVQVPETDIDSDQNFMELGADSMTAMSMVREIEMRYDIELPATLLFEYATLNELVDYLKTEIGDEKVSAQKV